MARLIKIEIGILVLFIVDRVGKWLAIHSLSHQGVFLIPRTTGFVLERNQGIAYSISLPLTVLIIVTTLIIFILIFMALRAYGRSELAVVFALSAIITGAFSNLIDRIRYGYVIDYVVLTSWPVFNLADVLILVGAVWLLWIILKHRESKII
jgi:signal peptidase II